ncbi:MAG: hypothetical protein KA419_04650 [Acidobacteria bacterium]|nr:hypothetical protein [Acidobacteriota bacterium]
MRLRLVVVTLAVVGTLAFLEAQAKQPAKCPRGRTDCDGHRGCAIDMDGDGVCDYAAGLLSTEPAPGPVTPPPPALTRPVAPPRPAAPKSGSPPKSAAPVKPAAPVPGTSSTPLSVEPAPQAPPAAASPAPPTPRPFTPRPALPPPYHFAEILAGAVLLYLLTGLLARAGRIRTATHRKIWNVILLLTFLGSCLIGLLLTAQINYGFWRRAIGTLEFWHVELGVAMAAVALFHAAWHLPYYRNLLKKSSGGKA